MKIIENSRLPISLLNGQHKEETEEVDRVNVKPSSLKKNQDHLKQYMENMD